MKKNQPLLFFVAAALLALVLVSFGCSKPSYIHLVYTPPGKSDVLKGKRVYVLVKDGRTTESIFGENIRKDFRYFTGIFALSVPSGEKDYRRLGTFDLTGLCLEAFKKRLERFGLEVLPAQESGSPMLEITLRRFFLDQKGRNYEAELAYNTRIMVDANVLATQRFTGKAERFKILGTGGAEKILGDIFTEMINNLDIAKLFSDAGL